MVNFRSILIVLVLIGIFSSSFVSALATTQVDVSIDQPMIYENQPIPITITITHDQSAPIDAASFKANGVSIKASRVKDVQISPPDPLMVAIYQYQVAGVEKGLHALPSISVSIGGKIYQSIPTTYQVLGAAAAPPQTTSSQATQIPSQTSNVQPFLKLEEIIQDIDPVSVKKVYLGQKITVGYRYTFNASIELVSEVLPLFSLQGFRNIGDKRIQNFQQGDISIVEITQIVEAIQTGEFSYGPSKVEGYAYVMQNGKKVFVQPLLHAETPLATFIVQAYPKENKPPSFEGALGKFSVDAKLITPSNVFVGDRMTVVLTIKGEGQLDSIKPPNFCCEPGFSGLFRMNDIPPNGVIKGDTKTFQVDLWPLSTSVKQIPPVIFSFFNPEKKSYETIQTAPIPIVVKEGKAPPPVNNLPANPLKSPAKAIEISTKAPLIEIEGIYPLHPCDLKNPIFGQWWVLAFIPLSMVAFLIQLQWRQNWEQRQLQGKVVTAQDLFKQALKNQENPSECFNLMKKAFVLRLYEIGEIANVDIPVENLPDKGPSLKVKSFLSKWDAEWYTGKLNKVEPSMIQEAEAQFQTLAKQVDR